MPAEMRSGTRGSAKGARVASGSSSLRGTMRAMRSARASAIWRAFAVTHTPEALTQERPPLSAIDATITSRYFGQSDARSGPRTTLL